MKGCRHALFLLILCGLTAYADNAPPAPAEQNFYCKDRCSAAGMNAATDCIQCLTELVQNFGAEFGYTLNKPPADPIKDIPAAALSTSNNTEQALVQTYIGALILPSNSNGTDAYAYKLDPESSEEGKKISSMANQTLFIKPSPNQVPGFPGFPGLPGMGAGETKSNALLNPELEQAPTQADPISQSLLTILSTPPSPTNCSESQTSGKKCHSRIDILNRLIPDKAYIQLFDNTQNDTLPILAQLNSNTLMSPMIIAKADSSELSDAINEQQASNFIRYVSGIVIPPDLPDMKKYLPLIQSDPKYVAILQDFVASIRVYAARTSVGLNNLYYILSKRIPQTSKTDASNPAALSSQALNEYKMATWRLFNLADPSSTDSQWTNKINQASPATIQKEMAILLAEINYQMYLSRQQQERLLLTNSVLLLLSNGTSAPNSRLLQAALSTQQSSTETATPTTEAK